MIAESFRNASHFMKFLFILFFVVIGFLVFMVLTTIISVFFFNIDLQNLVEAFDPSKSENINLTKLIQSLYGILSFGLPTIIATWLLYGNTKKYLRLNHYPRVLYIVLATLTIIMAMPIVNFLIELNKSIVLPDFMSGFEELMKKMENEGEKATRALLAGSSVGSLLSNLVVMAIVPALTEELLFRGAFQRLFHEWSKNIHVAIWISAFLFSAMHMQFYGLIPRMVLGAFLGYLFYWSGSLWLPIIAHFINNGIAVTMFYVKGEVVEKAETIGTEEGVSMLLFTSIIIVSALIYSFYRVSKEKKIILATSNTIKESDE